MMILAFSVNNKQKKFFKKLQKYTKCKIDVVSSKTLLFPSIKAVKYLKDVDFTKAIDLRVKDFYAKYNIPLPKKMVEIYYKIMAVSCFLRYFTLFKKRYNKVIVWNGFMFRQAIILEIAKIFDIKAVFVESAFLPNRIVVDSKGVNFYNSVPRDKKFFLEYKNDKPLPKELIPRNPRNAKKFSNIKKEELPKEYIFVPFQVDYDTQLLLFSPWIKDMRELFFVLKDIAQELKVNIVFKEHPSSRKEYPDLHKIAKESKYLMFANGYSTQELIQKSKTVITINSSVGIESLLFYKKVITLGEAFYNIEGIVYHANNKEELIKLLKQDTKIDKQLITNFLKYLYWEYLIEGNFKDYNENQIKQIEHILC